MKSSNRILMIFGIVLGVLVISAVVLVLALPRDSGDLLPENTPEGTVQRFLRAVQDKDYEKAYSYLQPSPQNKTLTYAQWLRTVPQVSNPASWRATLGNTTTQAASATVEVIIEVFRPSGPLDNPVRTNQLSFLLTLSNGSWLITSPFELYWLYY